MAQSKGQLFRQEHLEAQNVISRAADPQHPSHVCRPWLDSQPSSGNLASNVLALQAQDAAARGKVAVKPSQAVNDDRKSAAAAYGGLLPPRTRPAAAAAARPAPETPRRADRPAADQLPDSGKRLQSSPLVGPPQRQRPRAGAASAAFRQPVPPPAAASGQGTADQPGTPHRGGASAQRRLLEAEGKRVMWGYVPEQGLAESQAADPPLTRQAEPASGRGGHAARSQAPPVSPHQPGRNAQQQQTQRGPRAPDDKHGLWEYVPEQELLAAQEEDFDDLLRQADLMEPDLSQAPVSKASQPMFSELPCW